MKKNNVMNTYGRFNINIEKGCGTKVYDSNGNEYLDFVSGIAVNCLGHSHPSILKALDQQSKKIIHISNLYWNTGQIELASKLSSYSNHDKTFFCNSGTEAVETALKLARKYGKNKGGKNKTKILYMSNSFHGRTFGALSVTGQPKYQEPFMPLVQDVQEVSFNDIQDLRNKMDEDVCGVIIEPIQGEGGVIEVEQKFLNEARKLCDKNDALLIFDEVQCGIGRTGKLFAYQAFGVVPDIIAMAKALGGGFPIGATLATEKAASSFKPGDHGCTFGGNPLACSVALVVLEELVENNLLSNVEEINKYLIKKLNKICNKYDIVKDVRGKGLLLGISLEYGVKKIIEKCLDNGLLLVSAGQNVVRILPPLNVKISEIDQALKIIEKAILEISNKK